jgi:hypothetical protein
MTEYNDVMNMAMDKYYQVAYELDLVGDDESDFN